METKKKKKKKSNHQLSVTVLGELAARFLRPAERGLNLMKNVEMGQWFYLDHMRPVDKDLPYLNPLAFNTALYRHHTGCEANQAAEMHRSYVKYLAKVPCAGTAVFDPKCRKLLMVQGDFKGCPWGFPKGKMDDGETLMACAARETMEETGLDVAHLLGEKHKIQLRLGTPKKVLLWHLSCWHLHCCCHLCYFCCCLCYLFTRLCFRTSPSTSQSSQSVFAAKSCSPRYVSSMPMAPSLALVCCNHWI